MTTALRSFASDNTAGVHPEVLAAIQAANAGDAPAYGDDPWTGRAVARFRAELGERTEVCFVFNGTGANVVGLQTALRPWQAVICADTAHINVDECGAPERLTGAKLLAVRTADGKLRPADVEGQLRGIGVEHHVQPRVVSITQATEYGTVYTVDEVRALADVAHRHGLVLHMDGARIANAAASLDVPLRALTADAGVDVLSFGGTKNGVLVGEAVVVFDPALARDLRFIRKQGMQLASKMRFVAAQYDALLADGLWRRSAAHANRLARRLADGVRDVPGVAITQPVEANAVFATLPPAQIAALQARFHFYVWDERRSEVRWMTHFATTEADVDGFVRAVRETAMEPRPAAGIAG
ncbi:MAG TPA: low specificity L-threonine aldolase [Gemmatimonadales bacterium]|nr:low specificity L-threonine aldolase [Gemmatimonadales bacterium]